MRGALTRTWCFKDDHQRGMVNSLWEMQGHDVSKKVTTNGEWFPVKALQSLTRGALTRALCFKVWSPKGNGEDSLWWEVHLQGHEVSKKWPSERIIFWWRASFLKGSIVRQCLFSGQYSGCTFQCSQHCIGMFRQVVTNNNNQWNNCCRDILCYATLCCF